IRRSETSAAAPRAEGPGSNRKGGSARALEGAGEVETVDRRRLELSVRRGPVDRQGLAGDPGPVGRDGGLELGGGAVADADPVGVVEAEVLARGLDPVDHLAGAPLGDQLG